MTAVAGKAVVVTGIIPGHSRVTAQAKLREAGAFVQDTVTAKTDVLVTGAKVGKAKTDKAAKLGVAVVPWESIAWDGEQPEVKLDPANPRHRAAVASLMDELRAEPARRQIAPMLCADGALPLGPGWTYEIKWDGYRAVARIVGGRVALMSRSGKTDYAEQFPQIAAELATLPDCVLDGEIVVLDGNGGGQFSALAGAAKGVASFIAFDVLESTRAGSNDPNDLRALPLETRRNHLAELLDGRGLLLVARSPVFHDGPTLLAYVRENGMEGIVSKRDGSRYEDGGRSGAWVKTKVRLEQEFVVVGYAAGEGRRVSTFGALYLGYYDADGVLVPCGKVGTGFDDAELDRLAAAMGALRADAPACPVGLSGPDRAAATWVKPELVVQVAFQRWTEDGSLWHPSYQGQRHDKDAADVRRES